MDNLDFDYIIYDYGRKDTSKAEELFSIDNEIIHISLRRDYIRLQ